MDPTQIKNLQRELGKSSLSLAELQSKVKKQTRVALEKATDREGNLRMDRLPPAELLELSRKGLIDLSPEAEETLQEIVERERDQVEEEDLMEEEESEMDEEEVPDSFRALDSDGAPMGPSLGDVRKGIAGQQVSMEKLKRVNPELHAKLQREYGNKEFIPAEVLNPS